MVACKYCANQDQSGNKQKVAYVLSSYYNPLMIDTGKTDKSGNSIIKLSIIKHYNTHMGGVDRVDQQLHGIQVLQKTYPWYKKLAFHLIRQCSLNAQKVYAHDTGSNITFLDFLLSNIKLTFLLTTDIPINPCVAVGEDVERLTGRHFPSLVPAGNPETKDRPHKRCRVCYARGKRTAKGHHFKTIYVCKFCPSKPGLHPNECFQVCHIV